MGKLESPMTTITGIGSVTGAAILSEIGDISRFDSPRKLVAFAGLDATVTQSGEFEAATEENRSIWRETKLTSFIIF